MSRKGKETPTQATAGVTLPCPLVPLEVVAAWSMCDWSILRTPGVWANVEGRQIKLYSFNPPHPTYTGGYPAGTLPEGLEAVHLSVREAGKPGVYVGSPEPVRQAAELESEFRRVVSVLEKLLGEFDG